MSPCPTNRLPTPHSSLLTPHSSLLTPITPSTLHLNALILGGGIAGLWTLARLTREGYGCLLLTDAPLGAGQTIASQGIIHGGIKYTLGLADASDAGRRIAEMPEIWRACLSGSGEIDLRGARVLTDHQHLFTTPGLLSRIAGFGASKVIRTAVTKLAPDQRPALFAAAPRGIDIYRVDEPVLAIDSVLQALAAPLAARIARTPAHIRFDVADPAGLRAVELIQPGGTLRITADRIILAAGAGNEALMNLLWRALTPLPQRRPLHMVVARFEQAAPGPLFGHALGPSSLPRLTINTVGDVWYIGGQLAETGVSRSEPEQVAFAREELRACLPWLDFSKASLSTFRIDRAEGVADDSQVGKRPDGPVIAESSNLIVGWPTKLAFAPAFAADILARFVAARINKHTPELPPMAHPGFAPYPWA